jgi:hypothetical protein
MNTDKKKKLILPAFMAVLCAVMMVGVGYAALTSSFTTTANVEAGELEVTVNGTTALELDAGKIPYGVDTERTGTTDVKTYHVDAGTYALAKDKTVAITDNTGAFSKYKVTVEVKSDKLGEIFGANCLTGVVKDTNGTVSADGTTEKTLTLDISLVVSADKTGMKNVDNLSADDVKVIVTVEGVA